jgi:hypothetical protein
MIYLSTSAGLSEFPRQNAAVASQAKRLRPGQGDGPPPGDGPPAPSLLAAVLEPWRRSTMMDISHITSPTYDVIKHSGYYGSWMIHKHEKTLPIKSIWKFVSLVVDHQTWGWNHQTWGSTLLQNYINYISPPHIPNLLTIAFLVVVDCYMCDGQDMECFAIKGNGHPVIDRELYTRCSHPTCYTCLLRRGLVLQTCFHCAVSWFWPIRFSCLNYTWCIPVFLALSTTVVSAPWKKPRSLWLRWVALWGAEAALALGRCG